MPSSGFGVIFVLSFHALTPGIEFVQQQVDRVGHDRQASGKKCEAGEADHGQMETSDGHFSLSYIDADIDRGLSQESLGNWSGRGWSGPGSGLHSTGEDPKSVVMRNGVSNTSPIGRFHPRHVDEYVVGSYARSKGGGDKESWLLDPAQERVRDQEVQLERDRALAR